MNDFSDYAFQQPEGGPPDTSGRARSHRLWSFVAGAAVLVTAVALYYFVFRGATGDELVEVVDRAHPRRGAHAGGLSIACPAPRAQRCEETSAVRSTTRFA